MSERLVALWSWLGVHRLLAGWAAALAGLALCGGGIALGASGAEDGAFAGPPAVAGAVTGPATSPPGRVEAVVIARRPRGYLARTRAGDLVLIRVDARTRFRALGRAADATAVQRNTVVVVQGAPGARAGVFRARVVAVRRGATEASATASE